MSFTDIFHKHLGVNDFNEAPEKLMQVMLDKPKREELFINMLNDWDRDLSYDWFHKYFQESYSDRKKKKQDFTPVELSGLVNKLVNNNGHTTLDIASGTGGLLIKRWEEDYYKDGWFKYKPSNYLYHAEDISDRTLPFLLFNLSIRGMNATVFRGDSLSRKGFNVFFLENVEDSLVTFSNINVLPNSEQVEEYFAVKFVDKLPQDNAERKIYDVLNENGIEQLYKHLDTLEIDY